MQRSTVTIVFLAALLTSACGESAESTADVVQAATKNAVESAEAASKTAIESIQRAAESLDLSGLTPEVAKAQVQSLLERAGAALAEAKDSEMVQRVIAALEPLLDRLVQMKQTAAAKIDVHQLQATALEQIQRFRDDPRVSEALKTLHDKLQRFAR